MRDLWSINEAQGADANEDVDYHENRRGPRNDLPLLRPPIAVSNANHEQECIGELQCDQSDKRDPIIRIDRPAPREEKNTSATEIEEPVAHCEAEVAGNKM